MSLTPKRPMDRGALQPQHADTDIFGADEPLVSALENKMPGFRQSLLRQREQEAQADKLRAQAQHPEGAGMDESGSSQFQTNGDIFTDKVVGQVASERDVKNAEMTPAIAPDARTVGKGGMITDSDMNMEAAGSSLKAQGAGITNNRVAGRPDFYRMRRFYGR